MNAIHPTVTVPKTIHTLFPGDIVCVERDERMETLLGSCIAVVLTDQRRTIGAMCHIVHCNPVTDIVETSSVQADVAIHGMYARLRTRGYNPQLCEAFIYGGGNMFPGRYTQSHVGQNNSRWVLDKLRSDGVRVMLQDVGGNVYRRVAWTVGPDLPEIVSVSVQECR